MQVKLAQNNLLKEKNAVTVVEGELAHFRSLLAKIQQPQKNNLTQQKGDQSTMEDNIMDTTTVVSDTTDQLAASSSNDQHISISSNNAKIASSDAANLPNLDNTTVQTKKISVKCINSPILISRKLNSTGAKETKIKPGQKIANVVKKLSQERVIPTHKMTASNTEEVATHVEDKNTRRSLDAVVAKLHIVKKQEFEKQFHVNLGSTKQARENTKLDSVVEKLVAKQSQSQQLSSDYPLHFKTLNTTIDSPVQCTEADVSSTVPDNVDNSKMDVETQPVITEIPKFHSTPTKKTNQPTTKARNTDTPEKQLGDVSKAVIKTVTKQSIQVKLAGRPRNTDNVEPAHTVIDGKTNTVYQLRGKEHADKKETSGSNLASVPTKLSAEVPDTLSPRSKDMLVKVNKFIVETFAVKPKDLESLPGKDNLREILDDTICGSLNDFYGENMQVCTEQESSVPDAIFVKLFQVYAIYDKNLGWNLFWQFSKS